VAEVRADSVHEGLVCIGDSILAAPRSWGRLLADAGDWPLVRHAVRGARSWQVLDQVHPLAGRRYAVGALSMGANDVLFEWDAQRYDANLRAVLSVMLATCDRVLVQTFPHAFRRFPGSSPQRRRDVVTADRIIESAVADLGGDLLDGSDLRGQLLCPDRVHPSVRGHLLLADRAAALVGLPDRPSRTAVDIRNDHGRVRYLASTARTTVRELLARRHA
jgi:hypothetical protein